MNTRLAALVAILILPTPIYAQDNRQPVAIGEIHVGSTAGDLGFSLGNEAGRGPAPRCFFFLDDNEIGVLDSINRRIQVYSKDTLEFSRQLNDISYYNVVRIDTITTGFWVFDNFSLTLVDRNFAQVKKIPVDNFWVVHSNYAWTVDRSGKLECYDALGTRLDPVKTLEVIRGLNSDLYSGNIYTASIRASILRLIETGEYLFVDGKVVPRTFEQARTVFGILESESQKPSKKDLSLRAPTRIESGSPLVHGSTSDGTTVWRLSDQRSQSSFVGVYSAQGKLLAYFSDYGISPFSINEKLVSSGKEPLRERYSDPVIRMDTSGNIFYMIAYESRVKFFEIKRDW